MKICNIKLKDFIVLPATTDFDVSSKVLFQIYQFYKQHSQSDYYIICNSDNDDKSDRFFDLSNLDLYKKYGIVLESGNVNEMSEREYMLILAYEDLESEETLLAAIKAQSELCQCSNFSTCIVETDFSQYSADELVEKASMLHEVIPSCTILNQPLIYHPAVPQDTQSDLDNYEMVNIAQFFPQRKYTDTTATRINTLMQVLDEIHNYPDPNKKVVFMSNSEDRLFTTYEYCALAALGTLLYGKRFYLKNTEQSFTLMYMQLLFKREYMYAEDYVNLLLSFPDVSVMPNGVAFVLVKDHSRIAEADLNMSCVQLPFDISKKQITDTECTQLNLKLSEIEVVSLRRLYNLDSKDPEVVKEGMDQFFQLLTKMDVYISEKYDFMQDEILSVCNVIAYNYDGQTYIAYISYIKAELPFIIFPSISGYKPFRAKVDVTDKNVYDIRMYFDWANTVTPLVLKGLVDKHNMFFRPTDYCLGLLLQAIPSDLLVISDDAKLTLEEIGIWGQQTSTVRCCKDILKFIRKEVLMEQFFTIYGGVHPSVKTSAYFKMSNWR